MWVWIGSLLRILRSVPGVTAVRRVRGTDERIRFSLHGEDCQVLEPFRDNSRYWIGPTEAQGSAADLTELHEAFARYHTPPVMFIRRAVGKQRQ